MSMQGRMVKSLIDSDLYKLTMQHWVVLNYPEAVAEYTFVNRDKSVTYTRECVDEIREQVRMVGELRLSDEEYNWMRKNLTYLPISYLQYLSAYRFNPDSVIITHHDDLTMDIKVRGKWRDAILWEIPLLAIVSESYFSMVDTDWTSDGFELRTLNKAKVLDMNGCRFTDFGTRRRRYYGAQDTVVRVMRDYPMFMGTSNPYLAMKYGTRALGTCAHEAIGAMAVLESMNHPNAAFMDSWANTYNGDLGTMLPDTFGLESFLKDFSLKRAKLWDGVRHDSGDPDKFTKMVIEKYQSYSIDPNTKTIVYSNALDTTEAIRLNNLCRGRIRCSMGIGTYLTSDFYKMTDMTKKSSPANIVLKLTSINGTPVVKLSDDMGKTIGDKTMIRIMKYIHVNDYKYEETV